MVEKVRPAPGGRSLAQRASSASGVALPNASLTPVHYASALAAFARQPPSPEVLITDGWSSG